MIVSKSIQLSFHIRKEGKDMQKILTIRSSQGNLQAKLVPYLEKGYRIVSTTRGTDSTRVLNTYKWTVVLENDEPVEVNEEKKNDHQN